MTIKKLNRYNSSEEEVWEERHVADDFQDLMNLLTDGLYQNWYHVIPFDEAPPFIREISINGGDEDWVVLAFEDDDPNWYPPFWIENLSPCCVDRFKAGQWNIFICSHA